MDHRTRVLHKIVERKTPKRMVSHPLPRGTKTSVQKLVKFMKNREPEAIYKIINSIQRKPFHWLIGGLGGLGALDLAYLSGKLDTQKRGY